jgi:segregation and condensation protein A
MSDTASETAGAPPPDSLALHLDGFDGPLDLLLDLARAQKVDLAGISILRLVEQYLAVVEGARDLRLELAADWLVMAAWLAWLKSRLLLPPGTEAADEGELAAGNLAARLAELAAMRAAAAALDARPQLGRDRFARGAPEERTEIDRSGLRLDLAGLIRAYLAAARRRAVGRAYRVESLAFWTVADALDRLAGLIGRLPRDTGWLRLDEALPDGLGGAPLRHRAAIAGTLIAGLELARDGRLALRQDELFGPILLRGADA